MLQSILFYLFIVLVLIMYLLRFIWPLIIFLIIPFIATIWPIFRHKFINTKYLPAIYTIVQNTNFFFSSFLIVLFCCYLFIYLFLGGWNVFVMLRMTSVIIFIYIYNNIIFIQQPWPIFRHTFMSSWHLYKSRIEFILIFIILLLPI